MMSNSYDSNSNPVLHEGLLALLLDEHVIVNISLSPILVDPCRWRQNEDPEKGKPMKTQAAVLLVAAIRACAKW